jgi:hypothetical protein
MSSIYSQLYANATTLVDLAISATKPVAYDMYSGVVRCMSSPSQPPCLTDALARQDSSALNVLERAWMSWYQYWGNPIIATGRCLVAWLGALEWRVSA